MAKGTARNVLNGEAVDNFCAAVALLANHVAVADWVSLVVRNWILRSHPRFDFVQRHPATGAFQRVAPDAPRWEEPRPLDPPYPAWLDRALDRGDTVVWLLLDGRLNRDIRRLIEYLDDELSRGSRLKLDRLGFRQAKTRAEVWRRAQRATNNGPTGPGAIPVYREGGSSAGGLIVVQLTTRRSLILEGERMRHCVAIYDDEVAMGECEIYSVRAPDGTSLATIEVDPGGHVLQVKGKANGPVPPEARRVIQSFILSRGYAVVGDSLNVSTVLANLGPADMPVPVWLTSPEGVGCLEAFRYGGSGALPDIEENALLETFNDWQYELPPEARRRILGAIAPGRSPPLRLRAGRTYRPYGVTVETVHVDVPILLVRLYRMGFFEDLDAEANVAALFRRIENTLPTLVFRELDRVYILGRPRIDPQPWWVDGITSTADILIESPYDVTRQRATRHQAMLAQLNRLKADRISRSAPPDEDHQALRRLITGQEGVYAI